MIDLGQAAIGIIVLLVAVGALLYVFYSRTNAVEKTGYGALIMLSIVSLMIPILWIVESNNEAVAKSEQHVTDVQRGAALYAQYCYQCHGTNGQGHTGPKLNGNPAVNSLADDDILRIIAGGIYDPAAPTKPLMPAWSDRFGGPLTDIDIQNLFELIRSSDPAYLAKNGYTGSSAANGFDLVKNILQANNPTAYQTAVAQENTGQFGTPVDMTSKKAVTITIINSPAGASCSPACYSPVNVKVKVGTTITWVNKSDQIHTVTALPGTNPSNEKPAPQIFDSGINKPIATGGTFTYTVTTAAYNFNSNHTVVYYCQFHPAMTAVLTIVP
jgi:plastocyanin/mono/diheme cytochrome c family protein